MATLNLEPPLLVLRAEGRTTIDLSDVDCALLAAALRHSKIVGEMSRMLGGNPISPTPDSDARETALLKIFDVKLPE